MLSYDATGTVVLVLTLATLMVMVLLLRQRRSGKDVAIWFLAGVVGILLGAAALAAFVQLNGYSLARVYAQPTEGGAAGAAPTGSGSAGMGSGSTGMSMGSGSAAMGGMGMGGMGGGRGPSPKRDLTTLVRKVELLTGDISLKLSDKQASGLVGILDRVQAKEKMTDDEAKALHEELLALFDEAQQAKQDAIGLPMRRGAGGPGGGMGGGPGPAGPGPGGPGPGGANAGGPGGPGGGAPADPEANPFQQEQNSAAVKSLLGRFARPAADKAAADGPTEAKPSTEKPDAKPAAAPEGAK